MLNSTQQGTLYIVATPIGNFTDITAHAIDCLKSVDIIACEDTRTSGKLLNHFNITTQSQNKLWAYHDHNAEIQTPKLIEMLQAGHNIALISDAGTPLISDPGFRLVRACHEHAIKVSPVVGRVRRLLGYRWQACRRTSFIFTDFYLPKVTGEKKSLKA